MDAVQIRVEEGRRSRLFQGVSFLGCGRHTCTGAYRGSTLRVNTPKNHLPTTNFARHAWILGKCSLQISDSLMHFLAEPNAF